MCKAVQDIEFTGAVSFYTVTEETELVSFWTAASDISDMYVNWNQSWDSSKCLTFLQDFVL